MTSLRTFATAMLLGASVLSVATTADAAACRDAKGHFTKCVGAAPAAKPAAKVAIKPAATQIKAHPASPAKMAAAAKPVHPAAAAKPATAHKPTTAKTSG